MFYVCITCNLVSFYSEEEQVNFPVQFIGPPLIQEVVEAAKKPTILIDKCECCLTHEEVKAIYGLED